jgi:small GTP-binding protein
VSAIGVDALDRSVEVLSGLATADEHATIEQIRARIATRRLRVLIAGEAKRGKSTLVNRLLGQDVLPVGVIPVTAIVTTVHHATADEFLVVHYLDGRQVRYELDALAGFITEQGNPHNERQVRGVEVLLGGGLVDRYDVELVDTPGTGSVFEHNSQVARDALQTLDAAIFVVTADPPISAAERDLLREVSDRSVRTFIVLNKADQLDGDDLAQAIEFTQRICTAVTGEPTPVCACSARLGTADPGYRAFADDFERYLAASGRADAELALRGHLTRLAHGLLDAAMLTERGLQLAAANSADRVRVFQERIAELVSRSHELEDRCWAIERGLRRSLDQSAAQLVPRLIEACRARATAALDGDLAGLPAEQLEERGRAIVVDLIRDQVDRWRAEQADFLETGLTTIQQRVTADLDAQIGELRDAARELLDITLTVQPDTQLLQASQRFWYAFDRPIVLEVPLAATVRRFAPGRAQRAKTRVLDEIPDLADRQVGRARADLQHRLRESIHTLLATLTKEHQNALGRVQTAMADAMTLSTASSSEHQARQGELAVRVTALRNVLDELAQ